MPGKVAPEKRNHKGQEHHAKEDLAQIEGEPADEDRPGHSRGYVQSEKIAGRVVYVISKHELIQHAKSYDWASLADSLIEFCKSSRGSGFMAEEYEGQLYLIADAEMIQEFIQVSDN